jgi:hypothetical protein
MCCVGGNQGVGENEQTVVGQQLAVLDGTVKSVEKEGTKEMLKAVQVVTVQEAREQ